MIKLIFACSILLCMSSSAVFSQESTGSFKQFDQQTASQIDNLFEAYNRKEAPGFAVGVIQRGDLVYAKGFGIANLDYDIP